MTFDPSLKRPLYLSTNPNSQVDSVKPPKKAKRQRPPAEQKVNNTAKESFNGKQECIVRNPEVMARSIAAVSKKEIADFVTNVHETYKSAPCTSKKMIRLFFQDASPDAQAHFFSLINAENDAFFTHTIFALPRDLTTLHIKNHRLKDNHVVCIVSQLNKLQSLNLICHTPKGVSDECILSSHAVTNIAHNPNMIHLKNLSIKGCHQLNHNAVKAIAESRYLAGLENLSLEGRNFNARTAMIICEAPTMFGLRSFNLNGTKPLAARIKRIIAKTLTPTETCEIKNHQKMLESNAKLAEDNANKLVKLAEDNRDFLDLPPPLIELSHEYCELQESINLSILGKFPSPSELAKNIYIIYESDPCTSKKIIRQFFQHASLEEQRKFFLSIFSLSQTGTILSNTILDAFLAHIAFAIPKDITRLHFSYMDFCSSNSALGELKNLQLDSCILPPWFRNDSEPDMGYLS